MNVLINAISINQGGGLIVLKNIVQEAAISDSNVKWYVIVENEIVPNIKKLTNVILLPYPRPKNFYLYHFYIYEILLPKLIKKLKIDVLFSQTNFLSMKKINCKSLLMIHHAGFFSAEFEKLNKEFYPSLVRRLSWLIKKYLIKRSIQKADKITVQTSSLAMKICQQLNIDSRKIVVIPHGPGIFTTINKSMRMFNANQVWKIGYISKWGVQKDFITAFMAIKLLKDNGARVKLILTLDTKIVEVKNFLDKYCNELGINDIIENLGEINDANLLKDVYQKLDIFIFPSICESFGFPLVEAITVGIPVIVSETDSNIEIIGNHGRHFPKNNVEELVKQINYIMSNEEIYKQYALHSMDNAKKFSWRFAGEQVVKQIKQLASSTC